MKYDTKMMGNEGGNLPYEQPSLKKYGTMKKLTLQMVGSGADFLHGVPDSNTVFNDTRLGDIFSDENGDDNTPFKEDSIADRTENGATGDF